MQLENSLLLSLCKPTDWLGAYQLLLPVPHLLLPLLSSLLLIRDPSLQYVPERTPIMYPSRRGVVTGSSVQGWLKRLAVCGPEARRERTTAQGLEWG